MPFERSLEIIRRLDDVLHPIQNGWFSTPMLAEEDRVLMPAISRSVAALLSKGNDIWTEPTDNGWQRVHVRRTRQSSSPDLWSFAHESAESRKQYSTVDEAINAEVSDGNGTH